MRLKAKFWLEDEEGNSIGEGKIELLKNIKKFGSIHRAAKEMQMSYTQAWSMIEKVNRCFKKPLVLKRKGGVRGGGSLVTSEGERLLQFYDEVKKEINELLKIKEKELKDLG